jgi:hypothetical protein
MMTRIGGERAAFVFTAAFVILVAGGPVAAVDSPAGKWNTVDEKIGKVTSEGEIFEPGGAV